MHLFAHHLGLLKRSQAALYDPNWPPKEFSGQYANVFTFCKSASIHVPKYRALPSFRPTARGEARGGLGHNARDRCFEMDVVCCLGAPKGQIGCQSLVHLSSHHLHWSHDAHDSLTITSRNLYRLPDFTVVSINVYRSHTYLTPNTRSTASHFTSSLISSALIVSLYTEYRIILS